MNTIDCFRYISQSKEIFDGFGVEFHPNSQKIELGIRSKPMIVTQSATVMPNEKVSFLALF